MTAEIINRMGWLRRALEEAIGNGSTIKQDSASATQAVTGLTVGQIRGLNELTEMTYESVTTLLDLDPNRPEYEPETDDEVDEDE